MKPAEDVDFLNLSGGGIGFESLANNGLASSISEVTATAAPAGGGLEEDFTLLDIGGGGAAEEIKRDLSNYDLLSGIGGTRGSSNGGAVQPPDIGE